MRIALPLGADPPASCTLRARPRATAPGYLNQLAAPDDGNTVYYTTIQSRFS